MEQSKEEQNIPEGWVPGIQYLGVVDGAIVGMLNLRLALNAYLLNYAGHIGYSVRPSQRRKGYASEMLRLSLITAYQQGLSEVLVTCADDNEGSIAVIEKNQGLLEDRRFDQGNRQLMRRYWINTLAKRMD